MSLALDVYAAKHKPAGDNPVQPSPANLTEGAKEYEEHCAVCQRREGQDQLYERQVQPSRSATHQ